MQLSQEKDKFERGKKALRSYKEAMQLIRTISENKTRRKINVAPENWLQDHHHNLPSSST